MKLAKINSIKLNVKKILRYVLMYGVSRTYAKVRGRSHGIKQFAFNGETWFNPSCKTEMRERRVVAIIGCGNFSFTSIAHFLSKESRFFLQACYDIDVNKALSLCTAYGGRYVTTNWRRILSDEAIRVVYIASNHATHAEYGVECINAGKSVHIEKPHVVSHEQLLALEASMRRSPSTKVFLGFNRPMSSLFRNLKKHLDTQLGPVMINWFIVGHQIPQGHWYYDHDEGGRILGNLVHWTDMTLRLLPDDKIFPCQVIPAPLEDSGSEFMVFLLFPDGSCASLAFSAKGDTFEGVRETLSLQRGNLIARLSDFSELDIQISDKKYKKTPIFRDYGHKENITRAYCASFSGASGESTAYVVRTAQLVLGVKKAIETKKALTLQGDGESD